MKWSSDVLHYANKTIYFLVIKLENKKYYYTCKLPDDTLVTSNEWLEVVRALKKEGIELSWESEKGSQFLDDNGYEYLD